MIKNLLFVGKVIYLISPESDATPLQGDVEEEQRENGDEEEGELDEEGEREEDKQEEEEEDKDNRPPSLLWLIRKLSLMAKREAANSPKVPLKVTMETNCSLIGEDEHAGIQTLLPVNRFELNTLTDV